MQRFDTSSPPSNGERTQNNSTRCGSINSDHSNTGSLFTGINVAECSNQPKQVPKKSGVADKPYHVFNSTMKGFIVFIASAVAALSGLSSNIYFPAQEDISVVVNLSITTYMIAQGLGPSFWAPLADRHGRRMTLVCTLLVYFCSNIALAMTTNTAKLLTFRALQAAGCSSTIALGAGMIADISPPHERGGYIGWFSGVRQISLALGPVVGGLLAGSLGWRMIFWFLVAFSGLCVVGVLLVLPETLRRIVGNGELPLERWTHQPLLWKLVQRCAKTKSPISSTEGGRSDTGEIKPPARFSVGIFWKPFLLLREWDTLCALLFGGTVYTAWSMMVAFTTYLLKDVYQFNTIQVGLCFLANGSGCVAGSILAGKSLNEDYRYETQLWQFAQRIDPETPAPTKVIPTSFPLEKARLGKGYMYMIVMIWSLLLFGWSLTAPGPSNDPKSHWIVPLLAQFAAGWSATSVLTSNNALAIDLYPENSASASAVLNLSRCLMAAGGVAGVDPFLHACGPGWLSVLLVGIVTAGAVPFELHSRYGQKWREERRMRSASSQGGSQDPNLSTV